MKKCLLPRQLWHLALADGLFALTDVLYILVVPLMQLTLKSSWTARMMDVVLYPAALASVTLEMHVAAGVAALYWRSHRTMRLLSRSVWLCWVPGLVACVIDRTLHICEPKKSECTQVQVFIMLGAGCLTCSLYLLSAFRALWYPGQQERRAHAMVCLYVASYGVSLLPYLLVNVTPLQQPFRHISLVLMRFNGVANVLTYALNSKMARASVLAPDVLGDRHTTDNDFVCWAGVSNVRVGFDLWEHEQHLVPRVQSIASRRSEQETSSLEAVRTVAEDGAA